MKYTKLFILALLITLLINACSDKESKKNNESVINLKDDKKEQKINQLETQLDEAINIALNINRETKTLETKKLKAIQNLEKARDEAIFVSLDIQEENRDLKSKINKIDRDYNNDTQYFEKKIDKLKVLSYYKDKDITRLTKELQSIDRGLKENKTLKKKISRYRNENKKLKLKVRAIKRDRDLKQRALEHSLRQIQHFTVSSDKRIKKVDELTNVFEQKRVKYENSIEKLTLQVKNQKKRQAVLEKKLVQSLQKTDEAIKIALNINKEKQTLANKNKKINTKLIKKVDINNSKRIIASSLKIPQVEFKSDSAILTEQSSQLLDKIVSIMKEYPHYSYEIQGHTDSYGNEVYNLNLSVERAKSVNDYLISKGVKNSKLTFKGLGSSNPIADNETDEGRVQNRRVLIKVK